MPYKILNTISQTALLCKAHDIGLSATALRRLCNSGEIPVLRIGRKTLINWNILLDFVQQGHNNVTENCDKDFKQKVRRIDERLTQ